MAGRCTATASLVLAIISLTAGDVEDNKILTSIKDFFKPDERITGGLRSVMDRVHKLDTNHASCGKRQMCEALAESYIERSDGQFEFHRGFLRDIVDRTVEVALDAVSPLLHRVGMGAFARKEISFFNFVIDMVDSSLIWAGRVLAGRRFSRQLQEIGPLRSLLTVIPKPPFRHLPDMVDLAVDLTGIFDRNSGSFQYMRAGLMGYWKGGEIDEDENGICNYLYYDEAGCDSYWGIIPSMNSNKVTETLRTGNTNPLASKANYKFSGIEWKDLADPQYVLCKVDNYLSALDGHVNPPEEDGAIEAFNDIVIVRRKDNETTESMKSREENECRALLNEETTTTTATTTISPKEMEETTTTITTTTISPKEMDFNTYCTGEFSRFKRNFEKKEQLRMCESILLTSQSGSSEQLSFVEGIKFVGQNPFEPLLSTVNEDTQDAEDSPHLARSNINIDILTKFHDQTILIDKIQVNQNSDMDLDQASQIILSLGIEEDEGAIEEVYRLKTRKGTGLLLQLDSIEYRDQIIKQYRRSSIPEKLRKPKGKDLKQIVSLVTQSL